MNLLCNTSGRYGRPCRHLLTSPSHPVVEDSLEQKATAATEDTDTQNYV